MAKCLGQGGNKEGRCKPRKQIFFCLEFKSFIAYLQRLCHECERQDVPQ